MEVMVLSIEDDMWADDETYLHLSFYCKLFFRVYQACRTIRHLKWFCPSLESKVLRFKGRTHQIWLEPEGLSSDVIYPNGISCTMPEEHQVRLVQSIVGLENVQIVKPGYGVEYDYMDPRQLRPTLETLRIQNIYFAGQINGTTGYEEAAAQGLMAGINAALKVQNKPPMIVDRTEGYIGVLIDDLTTQGYKAGCVSDYRYNRCKHLEQELVENVELLKSIVKPVTKWRIILKRENNSNVNLRSAFDLLLNQYTMEDFVEHCPEEFGHLKDNKYLQRKLEIEAKYANEMESQMEEINEVRKDEQLVLPDSLDYMSMNDISTDARVKLTEVRPLTIAAASRIPGMTPAALVQLLKYVKMMQISNFANR
ncbi:gidA [Mytilus coruscus]|uniref:GidA n=1 Tax=Mytilus coruscus TaxID=42192 RepID=A0A6J8E032_MYTCO|nr:gidA [Mytilus coruscus]